MTRAKTPLDRSSDRQHGHANESKRDIIDGLQFRMYVYRSSASSWPLKSCGEQGARAGGCVLSRQQFRTAVSLM